MPSRHLSLHTAEPPALAEGLRRLRAELGVPTAFPAEVLAEAEQAAKNPALPSRDRTDIDFVTLDPESSTDLDQAFHLSRAGNGFLIRYAIADVAAFVTPGGRIDAEAHTRGQTLYAPNRRTPLHPPALSEAATSLLPGQDAPALVWELRLDSSGEVIDVDVDRAVVRSRAKLSYSGAQADLDAGRASEQLELLRLVGRLRQQVEIGRGGVSLSVPEQEVVPVDHTWTLAYRATLPVEDWNAQLSLATGMAAAQLMLAGGVGILRTLPPAKDAALARLRRTAAALGIRWPRDRDYPAFVRTLDASVPAHAAMLNACTMLFRGAGYQDFAGTAPEQPLHAAIAAPYAHTTAPLRRLVDRYSGEICVSVCQGRPVPEWVLADLPALPGLMDDSDRRAKKYERGTVDLVEAMVLAPHLGSTYSGTVLEVDPDEGYGTLQLADPAVEAKIRGEELTLGEQVPATLVAADLLAGKVEFRRLPLSADESAG